MATKMADEEGAPLPLKPRIDPKEYTMVTLTRKVNIGHNNTEKRSAEVPKINDINDVEYLLRLIHEFNDARQEERLNLTTSNRLRRLFRECLDGNYRDIWDIIITEYPQNANGFNDAQAAFIARFTHDTDFTNQQRYLSRVTKPYTLTVAYVFLRVQIINRLMQYLPGADGEPPYNQQQLKHLLFNMRVPDWKNHFKCNSGSRLDDPAFTLQRLEDYMTTQEHFQTGGHPNSSQPTTNRRRTQSNNNNNHNNNNNRDDQRRSNNRRRPRDRDNSQQRSRKKSSSQQQDIRRNGGDCRHHPGHHDWYYCFGNKNGPNYKPDYVLPPPPNQRQPRSRYPPQDAHFQQHPTYPPPYAPPQYQQYSLPPPPPPQPVAPPHQAAPPSDPRLARGSADNHWIHHIP